MLHQGREFENKLEDYNGEVLVGPEGKLVDKVRKPIQATIDKLLEYLYSGLEADDTDNYTVYTGVAGISLLHLLLFEKSGDRSQLECAISYLKHPLRQLKGRRFSFLCGDAGPLALAAVIYYKLGNEAMAEDCVKKLVGLHSRVCNDPSLPDEMLYGRAGYLYALLFVCAHIGPHTVHIDIIHKVYRTIVESGVHLSQEQDWRPPLMYAWHDKHYLGAAHGLAGIFYLLMQVQDDTTKKYIEELVQPSVEYMLSLRFPSGNCPSSVGSSTGDKLVHWCHGAPGWIHMFIMAYKAFSEDRYHQAALDCGEVIWRRGLLKKGYGICHGVAGNAYAFLALYQLTGDPKHLHRAVKFAEWCGSYGDHGCRQPDTPFSLFEGVAGTVHFLVDLLDPMKAKFPAFCVP